MRFTIIFFIVGCILSFWFFSIPSIYAHKEIQVGNYTLEVGWEEEPPLLNMRNNVVVYVFENESAVRNAMKDLSTSINYGGLSKELKFVPSEESAGLYLAEIIPSKVGSYSLTLKGNINTQNIGNDIEIEDVEDAKKLTFPIITDDSGNINIIGKQITPLINDFADQINELNNEINSTKEIIQKMNNEDDSLKFQIEKTNLLSYIAIGLSASSIIVVAFRAKVKKTEK
jgi:hypothetical protein